MSYPTLLFIACGLAIAAAGVPLLLRRIPQNRLYGLRLPSTLRDEWVWYEANARTGRDLVVVGLLQVVIALILGSIPGLSEDGVAFANVFTMLTLILLITILGWRRAGKLTRMRERDARSIIEG